MSNYLEKLKKKRDMNEKLFAIITEIFNKLLDFFYFLKFQSKKLQKKLYENIDTILIGNDINIDYKSGYYDAVKKELYIKDLNNIESVYLRILYALSTTEISKESYAVGYSTASLSTSDYKIRHSDFGINRAVTSNLACRLLYTTPTTLSIMPTYRTYENDFLGNKIASDNDIYFLEGKLLAQICYILDINEEELYNNLFIAPKKYLKKLLSKMNNKIDINLFKLLDNISRNYSAYNKLIYFNKLLNENYINSRRKVLKSDIKDLEKQKDNINLAITNALSKLSDKYESNDDLYINIEDSLSEEINTLEENILSDISKLQNILIDYLIDNKSKYSSITYAIKLKELNKILVVKNDKLEDAIFKTISIELMNTFENTASNMIEKIKYSIINEILSSEKYIKIYKNMEFKKLTNVTQKDNYEVVAVTVDDSFVQLIGINKLNFTMKTLEKNTHSITLNNMGYLLNTPSLTQNIRMYEKIFTIIHTKFPKFSNVRIDNMYLAAEEDFALVVIPHNDTFSILQVEQVQNDSYNIKMVKLSESYTLFNLRNNSLPAIYNKKESKIQRLLSLFLIA